MTIMKTTNKSIGKMWLLHICKGCLSFTFVDSGKEVYHKSTSVHNFYLFGGPVVTVSNIQMNF